MLSLESQLLFQQDDGTELGRVVFDVEPILLALNDSVTPTHADVVDTNLTFMSTPELELWLLWSHSQKMNISRSILVKGHRFQENIVVVVVHLLREIDNLVDGPLDLEGVGVHLLANLAFETLPIEWANVLVLSVWWFFLFLSKNPILQALEMNQTDGTFAFACNNQWIVWVLLRWPANSALNLIFGVLG